MPLQVLEIGVTVMVAVIGTVVRLAAVKILIFPVPLPAIPIEGVSFTHENEVLATLKALLNITALVVVPLQTT